MLATRTPSMLGLLAECWQSLRSAPQSSPSKETGRAIETDVYSVSPGQAAAHGGRAEHCGSRALFFNIASHILTQVTTTPSQGPLTGLSHPS